MDGARPATTALPPLTREQILITAGVMAGIAVAALDSTVVGTAMPTIIGQLGGLEQYGWVFAGYLLTATTTVPLYSKLADIYGRKPIFLFGLALFVIGSMLCGFSTSMPMLIAFRTLQGLGAGAVQPIAFTIVGDTFEVARRARMQGLFSAVWGFSAIVGPAIGGIITQTIGWRWVFFVNLPVGLVAAALVGFALHEHVERRRHTIDWAGAATLTGGVALLLVAVSEGGAVLGWTSPGFLALLALSVACLVAFVVIEPRAREPLVDFQLIRVPVIAVGLAVGTLAGVVMYGLTAYVPPMVQGVHGGTPVDAGIAVAAMSIGWPIGSVVGGRTMLRFGPRPVVVAGTVMLVAGSALLTQLAVIPSLLFVMLATGVTGLGMGLASTTILVVVQSSVDWRQRGMATGLVQFSRTIGGAVGVGLMGAVLTAHVGAAASAVLDPLQRQDIPPDELAAMSDALASGLTLIYIAILVCAVLAFVLAARAMPMIRLGARVGPVADEVPEEADVPGSQAGSGVTLAGPPGPGEMAGSAEMPRQAHAPQPAAEVAAGDPPG
jgi:EmrB/QacA subfamily drug resistance transporter